MSYCVPPTCPGDTEGPVGREPPQPGPMPCPGHAALDTVGGLACSCCRPTTSCYTPCPSVTDRLRLRGLPVPLSTLGQTHTSPAPSLTGVCENRGTPHPTALARGRPYCHHLLLQLAAVEAEARHHTPVRRARHAGLREAPAAHRAHGSWCCGERRQAGGARRGPPPHCLAARPAPTGPALPFPPAVLEQCGGHRLKSDPPATLCSSVLHTTSLWEEGPAFTHLTAQASGGQRVSKPPTTRVSKAVRRACGHSAPMAPFSGQPPPVAASPSFGRASVSLAAV